MRNNLTGLGSKASAVQDTLRARLRRRVISKGSHFMRFPLITLFIVAISGCASTKSMDILVDKKFEGPKILYPGGSYCLFGVNLQADSWAGLLPQNELDKYCFTPNQKIAEHIKTFNVPVICFPRGIGKNYVDFCSVVKPNCISIDYDVDPKLIKNKVKEIAVQGGLDPKVLLKDNKSIKKEVQNYLNIFSGQPYVFNLGHGVLPETKPETIQYVTDLVRNFK